jgi:hypothetical protein
MTTMNSTNHRAGIRRALVACVLVSLATALPLAAHEGEDHGPPPDTLSRPVLPRAIAHGDSFELVGILERERLLVYLDAADSNAPVAGATLQVEGAGLDATAKEVEPGVYALPVPKPLPPGTHPLTFTVETKTDADLLAAPLVVPAPEAHAEAGEAAWAHGLGPLLAAGFGGAALGVGVMAFIAARRRSLRTPA